MSVLCGFKEGGRPAVVSGVDLGPFCNQKLDDIQIAVAGCLVQWASVGNLFRGFDICTMSNQDLGNSQIAPHGCNMKGGSEISLFVDVSAVCDQGLNGVDKIGRASCRERV